MTEKKPIPIEKRYLNGSDKGSIIYIQGEYAVFGVKRPNSINKLGGLCPEYSPYGSPMCVNICDADAKITFVNGKNVCDKSTKIQVMGWTNVEDISKMWRLYKHVERKHRNSVKN